MKFQFSKITKKVIRERKIPFSEGKLKKPILTSVAQIKGGEKKTSKKFVSSNDVMKSSSGIFVRLEF